MKKVLVVLAEGFEEIEAVTPIDVLRRAGFEVTIAAVGSSKSVKGSHGIRLEADLLLKDIKETPDAVVMHGGIPGAENLAKSKEFTELLSKMKKEGRLIAAICAAPALVLAPAGILEGKKATCYPGYEKELIAGKAIFSPERVVVDGHVITSRGPGSALEFSLEIVRSLADDKTADKLAKALLAKA